MPPFYRTLCHYEGMRYITHLLLCLGLLTSVVVAQTIIGVDDVATESYLEWVVGKNATWTSEIAKLRALSSDPEQMEVASLTLAKIQKHAELLEAAKTASEESLLKNQTHKLVYHLETTLEAAFSGIQKQQTETYACTP